MSPLRRIVTVFPLVIFLIAGQATSRAAAPTYQEWREACAKLPSNRSLNLRLPPRNLLPLQSFAELDRVLDEFFALSTNGPLATAASWVGESPAAESFLNTSRGWFVPPEIPFQPFAQKLVLPANAKVFLEGDLHGDVHSLLAVLDRLNQRKLLSEFKIIDPDLHVIFLGDYTDRGMYGTEVLYTLLRFKLANPDRVHFGRGNHEDLNLIARYGFLAEGQGKYGREFKAAKILRAYDFLPVVIYLGSGNDFLQVNHGGMEPGYDPAALLASSGTNRFELIGKLKQATFHAKHAGWLDGDGESADRAARELRDFTPTAPISPTVLGFMWNDFTVFSDEPAFAVDPGRAYVYGKQAVEFILKAQSEKEAKVHAVIRAHQHSGIPNPLMHRLVASKGLFRHWQETNSPAAEEAKPTALAPKLETRTSRPIPEGSVWTFNVSPDSVYGQGCNFGFVTFGILQFAEQFSDWRIEVESFGLPTLEMRRD